MSVFGFLVSKSRAVDSDDTHYRLTAYMPTQLVMFVEVAQGASEHEIALQLQRAQAEFLKKLLSEALKAEWPKEPSDI